MRGTELHAEPARLTTLDDDGYATFSHEYPHGQERWALLKLQESL